MKSYNPENFLVLVVDDVKQNLILLGDILEDAGYKTTFASSGRLGLERAQSAQPDLILLDLMMPDLDGLKVCDLLKDEPSLAETPVIFLTASNDKQHLIQAFSKGAVDYVTKPFNKHELLARVKTHLQLKDTTEQLKQALEEVDKLAKKDFLTNIDNRRSFFTIAQEYYNRSQLQLSPFSLLILDIDNFKKINDSYTHVIGDLVIKFLVETVQKIDINIGCFARLGGEEFIILLPETELNQGLIIAETIRKTISKQALINDSLVIDFTVSIGVASYQESDTSLEMIIQRADNALYQAKQQGRNRVCTS